MALAIIHEQLIAFRDTRNPDSYISSMETLMIGKYNKYWDRYEDMNSALFFA